jgi:hypothetical protein
VAFLENGTVKTLPIPILRHVGNTNDLSFKVTLSNPTGGAVELWTIDGGRHEPTFHSGSSASGFAPRVIDWLLAHPKP